MIGPFVIEAKVYLTDGAREAKATYSFPIGKLPTKEDIEKSIKEGEAEAQRVDAKFRAMNPGEFQNAVMQERFGISDTFAFPEEEWEKE